MKTHTLKVLVFLLLITAIVASPTVASAQTGDNPPDITNNQDMPASYYDDEMAAIRATEIALDPIPGDCSALPAPTFEGVKRDLTLNEDTTKIVVYYDESISTVCVIVWGSWPGTVANNGVSEFDSKIRVYRNDDLFASEDQPLIKSNPATNGVPFHKYTWKVPCGSGQYYVLVDFFQQQILDDQRLGMPHRDWSGIYRPKLCKLYLPFVSGLPRIQPTCPTNWKLRVVSPNDGDDLYSYTINGDTSSLVYQLIEGQTIYLFIEKDGRETRLENGETTLYGPDKDLEFGDASRIVLVGGRDLGYYTYTVESSFITSQGLRCWNHFQIFDPPAVMAQEMVSQDINLTLDQAYTIAFEEYKSQIDKGLSQEAAYLAASTILLNK